jgi:hypothetical protein
MGKKWEKNKKNKKMKKKRILLSVSLWTCTVKHRAILVFS